VQDLGMSTILSYHGHAGCFGSGINFHINRLHITVFTDPVNESDGKWKHLVNPGPAPGQKLSCSGRMARHQRITVLVNYKHTAYAALCRNR
jgi:hypothetical protein